MTEPASARSATPSPDLVPIAQIVATDAPKAHKTLSGIFLRRLMWATGFALVLTAVGAAATFAQSITYVTNCGGNTVSVIYTATHEIPNPPVRATLQVRPPGVTAPYCPIAVAFTPYRVEGNANGQFAYVVNRTANNVTVLDTATGWMLPSTPSAPNPIPVGTRPSAIAMSPICLNDTVNPVGEPCYPTNQLQGTFAYVVNTNSDSLSVIDINPQSADFNEVVATIPVGDGPSAVAFSQPILEPVPGGNGMQFSADFFAYVTNTLGNSVSVIDTATHTVVDTIPLGAGSKPSALAFDRTSDWAYVVNAGTDNVTPINTNTRTAATPIAVGDGPAGIAVTVDFTGSLNCANFRAYVTNTLSDSFSVINIEPGCAQFQTVITTTALTPLDKPIGVSVLYPDEDFVYITNSGSKTVSVIDSDPDSNPAQYNFQVGRVKVGNKPQGIDNTPRIPYTYVANSGSNSISVVGASPQIGDPHPVLATIPLTFSPSWMSLHRNQDFLYIADAAGGKIQMLNTISLKIEKATLSTLVIGTPHRLAMPPDGCCTYVTSSDGNIYAIDIVSLKKKGVVLNSVSDCDNPQGINVHPDNYWAYIACTDTNKVLIVNTHAQNAGGGSDGAGNGGSNQGGGGAGAGWNKVVGNIPIVNELGVGRGPIGVGLSHLGHRALVMNSDNTVSIIDTRAGSPTKDTVLATIAVAAGPNSVAFNEDDEYAYVTNSGADLVTVIRLSDNTWFAEIAVGDNPQDVFINLGERTAAYVTNMGDGTAPGTLSIIDVQADSPSWNTVLDTVTVGVSPIGLIITEP